VSRNTFFCIDAHTCGNPVRVVAGGAPQLRGDTMADYRQDFMARFDWVRRALMFEPRGHDVMSGSVLYTPVATKCDLGFLFIETSGCLPMCGHGTIGTVTVALESGLIGWPKGGHLRLEVPAGQVEARVSSKNGLVDEVRLFNVASYLEADDLVVDVPGVGEIKLDVAYGGNFYAIIEPQKNYQGLESLGSSGVQHLSPIVRELVNQKITPIHPEDRRIGGVSHVMWTDKPNSPGAHAKNAVFYGAKGIDRSPCGTGTSARMAQLYTRGKLSVGDSFIHESIIGSLFQGRVESTCTVGNQSAIRPSIGGWARIIGNNTIFVDDRDPFAHGFQVQ